MKKRYEGLVWPLKELQGMQEALQTLNTYKNVKVIHMVDSCKAHFCYSISRFIDAPTVIITYDEISTKYFYEDMQFLMGEDNVLIYPARDILFSQADVHSMDITAQRIRVIHALEHKQNKIIIIPIEALLNPISPRLTWQSYTKMIEVGEIVEIEKFINYLLEIGYQRVTKVEGIGQFAVRGGIIDIYTPISKDPYRIEWWDEEVDSIRTFHGYTQRSIEKVDKVTIVPVQEIICPISILEQAIPAIQIDLQKVRKQLQKNGKKESAERIKTQVEEVVEEIRAGVIPSGIETYVGYTSLQTATLLDYLEKNTILYLDEPKKIQDRYNVLLQEYEESMKDRLEYGHILPKQIEFLCELYTLIKAVTNFRYMLLMNFDAEVEDFSTTYTLPILVHENNTFYNNLELLEKDIKEWKKQQKKIILFGGTSAKALRIQDELEARGVFTTYSEKLIEPIAKGQVIITKGSLNKGFSYPDIQLYIIADKDLFGKDKAPKKPKKKYKGTRIESFLELVPGDYVVHETHGIGVFKGIEKIVVEGISRDNLKIEYADNCTLYVTINQLEKVQKYVGAEGKGPKLSKIGSSEWRKAKTKAKSAMKDIAKDLIKLYSQRQHARGFTYEPDTLWQKEFEEMFPYEETEDQLQAIEDVKKDMETDKITDRLICGDVGYGKTEVAIRAAFKAVQNSKQVVYLVPTTILAQQHYNRFKERMKEYPVTVELLSRFRTPKQIKLALEGLKNGQVDIIIGTHRLLSKDVKFKNLGLVIIDEEQRFGVTHKEKLKQMRTQVDVITLTATPIPRTLHMSLIGIRDMSVLDEAPLERKPVQTYVIEYSEDFIKDAINRELARGGQVYFLHNQVRNIEEKADQIQKIVPHGRVAYAHGQMGERELEKIMLSFMNGEIDILVCTTIIETGLDISNVNTILINDADRMGLSQLYQLRGRVGRSNKMGYAYLMYQKNKVLKEIAEKRLQAIKQFTQLGSGFKIAMRDLEIRGAGNLLGAQQHGHMETIGYELYCKMLTQVVSEEQGIPIEEEFDTSIEIKINAYIPPQYIEDESQKLDIYKKIASITNQKEYDGVQEELEDRYGDLPDPAQNLLDIALVKAFAHDAGIVAITENANQVVCEFKKGIQFNMEKVQEILDLYPKRLKWMLAKIPILKIDTKGFGKKEMLGYIKSILQDIKKLKIE